MVPRSVSLALIAACAALAQAPRAITIPQTDLSARTDLQTVVDREAGQYLGHPTTVLLEDGRTMLTVYPKGHGKGGIIFKRSADGGRTWSDRLPVPANWETSQETPTLHRVTDAGGKKRLILFSGLYPIRLAVSEDDGATWTPLAPIGAFGGIVAMSALVEHAPGVYGAYFHDDGRFIREGGAGDRRFRVYRTLSRDGGLTWSAPVELLAHAEAHLCEPGIVRSPDGRRLAMLLRENSRKFNSFITFSDDEGATWSEPREMNAALTGDRHIGVYTTDGRLFLTFRDTAHESPTRGSWVGWLGSWDDLTGNRAGARRFLLLTNHHRWDCCYPGLERLPGGSLVTTTYGHWTEGEPPYVVTIHLPPAVLKP
jgi:hypothetical protein